MIFYNDIERIVDTEAKPQEMCVQKPEHTHTKRSTEIAPIC